MEPSTPNKAHGGKRPGSGRKAKFGEPTTLMRVPESAKPVVRACQIFCVNGVSVVNGESIAELNGKTSQRRFPVADRHRPFLADVA